MSDPLYSWVDAAKFEDRINRHGPNGCHIWDGVIGRGNHPQYSGKDGDTKVTVPARRVAWTLAFGPIPAGLELRVQEGCAWGCVNPAHSTPVTRREVVLTSECPPGLNAKKTTCPAGHLYAVHGRNDPRGGRGCRGCERDRRLKAQLERAKGRAA